MNTDQTKAEQNFITCATNMHKFMHEYSLISSGDFDEIGHTAMKHPILCVILWYVFYIRFVYASLSEYRVTRYALLLYTGDNTGGR